MIFTATDPGRNRNQRFWALRKMLFVLMLAACVAVGFFTVAHAQAETRVTVSVMGDTAAYVDTWQTIPLTARFDVSVNGKVIGRITANPDEEQLAAGETDTFTVAENVTEVQLIPVAEDVPEGYSFQSPITLTVQPGEENQKTVFAYAQSGFFSVVNVSSATGESLSGAEYVVLDAQSNMVLSFSVGEGGTYTAVQALPNGTYQLVQMRAPDGTMLLDDPISFPINTYFGSTENITTVTVSNAAAPVENGQIGNLTLSANAFTHQGDAFYTTLAVSGLCDGQNTLPLKDYTVTVTPADLFAVDGEQINGKQAVYAEQVTLSSTQSSLQCEVQGLDADGEPLGDAVRCAQGVTVSLTGARGVKITYLNENGETDMPVGFNAGTITLKLRCDTTVAGANERTAATATLSTGVTYTYQYSSTDGGSDVTASSNIDPVSATLTIPDGKIRLAFTADAQVLVDGTQAVVISAAGAQSWEDTFAMAAELPLGARTNASMLPQGATLLRSEDADTVVFMSDVLAEDGLVIPVEAGTVEGITMWIYDPQSLPQTLDNPEGYLLDVKEHSGAPMLDTWLRIQNGRYAVQDVFLPEMLDTGVVSGGMQILLSGTIAEQTGESTKELAQLCILLATPDTNTIYAAFTDESGVFTVTGDAIPQAVTLTALLPANTMGQTAKTQGFETVENLALPQSNYAIVFSRLSGLSGQIATQDGTTLSDVTLQLLQNGNVVRTAKTNQNGVYTFSALQSDTYDVLITLADGVEATLQAQVGVSEEANGFIVRNLALAYGENQSLNLTATLLSSVTGAITLDDAPAANVTITLTGESGATLSTLTDENGAYTFAGLSAGTYYVNLQLPENQAVVAVNGESVEPQNPYTATYMLAGGKVKTDKIAMVHTATITGVINSLGAGKNIAIASVNMQSSAATDVNGGFTFACLPAGDYTVYAPLIAGETLLADSAWSVSEQGDMIWLTISVAAGERYTLPDVEYVAMTSIAGVAYLDDNGSLTYTGKEQLMSGVPVALQKKQDGAWSDVGDTVTNEYGQYTFADLSAGTYRVVSYVESDLYVAAVGGSTQTLGTSAVRTSMELNVANGENLAGKTDIALCQSARIEVTVFFDNNENGMRGDYERAIAGITVQAVAAEDPAGEALAEAVTDAEGIAALTALPPGSYVLRVTLPDSYLFTTVSDKLSARNSCIGDTDDQTAVSGVITVQSGETAAAGVATIKVGSFSGRVWLDTNNDGLISEDEPGVAGVLLTLSGSKTGNTYQITTDDTGVYVFPLLRDDKYELTAELPEGYLFARYTKSGGDNRSVFTTDGTSASRDFSVNGAEDVISMNVGLIERAAITGIAFLDMNYNGVYDEGEPPYEGVTVEVIRNSNDKSIGKVVTGEDGIYTFDSLRTGDYRLRAILPNDGSTFTVVPQNVSGVYNQFAAREGRRENSILSITFDNGDTVETCIGVARGADITGTVYYDKGYDGTQDKKDSGVSGIKVQLMNSAGEIVETASASSSGAYTLSGIMPGEYTVRFLRKDGYAFTRYRPDEDGGNDVVMLAKDGYGETNPLTVTMGEDIEQVNAGMLPSSTLTGIFFDDANDNGLMDEGETGYTDGSVRLLSADGEVDLTESVGEDGVYFFDGVMPGEYTVTYLLPLNATMAKVTEGGNTLENQGQENVVSGLTVESGKEYAAQLVGAVTLGTFEGYAFHDVNGNGMQDEGEEALAGVALTCTPDNTALETAKVVTDADGSFSITGLRPASYALHIALPNGTIFSGNLTQSDLTLDTAQEDTFDCPWSVLTNRAENAIGAVAPATIMASVWLDENRDGQHADGERLLSGLSYELYDENQGRVVKTARSGEDGIATFSNVRPSVYTVRFALSSQTQPSDGDSTFVRNGSIMSQSGIVITEGMTFSNVSGSLISYTSIGGTVALDENGASTVQAGVTVTLYMGSDTTPLQTTVTDETGEYRFDGLWPGEYRMTVSQPEGMIFIRQNDPNYPAGTSVVASTENAVGQSDTFTVEMAQNQLALNAVLIKPAHVGDQAWLDTNKNGLVDANEPSINGVTVQLLENGEVAYTTVTNAWGYYEFSDVYPGAYTLRAAAYPALAITQPVPALQMISSCLTAGDGESATSDEFSVQSGTKNFDFNLGYILPDGETMPQEITKGGVQQWPADDTEE